jgi:hypothetical protein
MGVLRKQESPTDRIRPACSGFPHELEARRLGSTPNYLGGEEPGAGVIAELLVPSAGAIVELLLPSGAGAVVELLLAAGAGAAAGGVVSVLLQAVNTSAAARAPRASFVFIDESPECMRKAKQIVVERKSELPGL